MGYILAALSGKIAHFNSIMQPVDNGLAQKIKLLPESPENILISLAFVITQESVKFCFHPDKGPFRKVVGSLDNDRLTRVYHILMKSSVAGMKRYDFFTEGGIKKLVHILATVLSSTEVEEEKQINHYMESSALGTYLDICEVLGIERNGKEAVYFGLAFNEILHNWMSKFAEGLTNKS